MNIQRTRQLPAEVQPLVNSIINAVFALATIEKGNANAGLNPTCATNSYLIALPQPDNGDKDAQDQTDYSEEAKPGDKKVVDRVAYQHTGTTDHL